MRLTPGAMAGTARADTLAGQAPPQAWKRLSAGDGSKGPRWYDWALAALPAVDNEEFGRPGRSRWLLLRRSITDPEEVDFYLCAGPAATSLQTLVRVAGSRWAIESCFQQAKTETGLDHYQVRGYQPWYRHVTLAMLAYADLAVVAATDPKAAGTWSASAQARSAVSWHT